MAVGLKYVCPICDIEVSIFGYKTHCRAHVAKGEAREEDGDFIAVEGIEITTKHKKISSQDIKEVITKESKKQINNKKKSPAPFDVDGAPLEFDFVAGRHFYNITNCYNQEDLNVFIDPKARVESPYLGMVDISRVINEKYLKRFQASVLSGECAQFQRIKSGSHYKIIYPKGQYYEIITFNISEKEMIRMRAESKAALKVALSMDNMEEDVLSKNIPEEECAE